MILVYLFALSGAFFLAVGFVVQQHVAADTRSETRVSPLLVLELIRRPAWLAGIAAMTAGDILGALALGRGSLTLVEPLGATNLFFALPLAAMWRRSRPGAREYAGAVALIVGLAGFMAAAGPARMRNVPVAAVDWLIAGLAVVAVAGLLTWAAKRLSVGEEATLLATAAGLLFGLQDALTQRTLVNLSRGVGPLLSSWPPYALLAVAILGIALGQNAFKLAPLPASLPAITIAEPLCGIGLGAGLLAQHVRLGAGYLAIEAVSLAVMALGVFLVARSPVVTGFEHRKSAGSQG